MFLNPLYLRVLLFDYTIVWGVKGKKNVIMGVHNSNYATP